MARAERLTHYSQETFNPAEKGMAAHMLINRFKQSSAVKEALELISSADPTCDPTLLVVGDERFNIGVRSNCHIMDGRIATSMIFDLDKVPVKGKSGVRLRLFTEYRRDRVEGSELEYTGGNVCLFQADGEPFSERHNNPRTVKRVEKTFSALLPPEDAQAPAA